MVNKDLGMVTAYAYAVSKGYTGTEEEFAALMADYAAVGQRAEAAATAAAASATAASGSASDSAASATAAEGFAGDASTSAGNAAQSASQASQSATAASGSATAAAGSATQAAGSATTAGNKATEAVQSATAAAASATAAGQSATAAQTAQTAAETAQTAAETAQSAAEDAAESVRATLIVNEASGAIATFPDGADGVPMRSVTVDMEPIQEGTGDPSPENVRPITGRDTVTVTRAGKNLLDIATPSEEGKAFGLVSGNPSKVLNDAWDLSNYLPVIRGESYVYSGMTVTYNTNATIVEWSDNNKGFISYQTISNASILTNGAIMTAPEGASYCRVTYKKTDTSENALQYEKSSSRTSYEPCQSESITIPLGQTVYGGSDEVVSGTLTNNRASITLTDASQLFGFIQSAQGAYAIIASNGKVANASVEVICDRVVGVSFNNRTAVDYVNKLRCYVDSNGAVTIRATADSQASSASELFALFENAQIVYELATPVTVQLTAQQLTTLLGTNNVWSDADSVTVDYVADTKLYIEQLTEPDADMVADANITSGAYFMVGNQLFLATANIASGATIVPGVNCTRTNLAEALNALNA